MDFLSYIQNIDISCVRFIREHIACSFLDFIMPLITLIGEDGILWIVLSLVLMFFKKTRKCGFVMALSLLIGFLIVNKTIKPLVGRTRPYVLDGVPIIIDGLSDYSFPSGHTLCCFEAAVSLIVCKYKKWGYSALVCAVLVAISRVYLYVHYPTDVITGAVLGALFAFVSHWIVTKLYDICKKSNSL